MNLPTPIIIILIVWGIMFFIFLIFIVKSHIKLRRKEQAYKPNVQSIVFKASYEENRAVTYNLTESNRKHNNTPHVKARKFESYSEFYSEEICLI